MKAQQCNCISILYHPQVGYGSFVRKYNGRYGLGLVIRLDNGRNFFAPINEFIIVNK